MFVFFGVNDNPKENRLFGRDLDKLEDTLGVRFWEENGQVHTLWSAALYQEADTIREATDAALELYEIVTGGKDFDRSLWTAVSHKSLCAGFNEADPDAIIAWNKRMADLVTMDGIAKAIRDQVPAGSIRKAAVSDKDSEGMAGEASEKKLISVKKCVCIIILE